MCWHDVCLGSLFVLNEVDTRVRNAPHASKERSPKNVCMRFYIWRKELQKWWEHVLSCYGKTCNTRSKAAHLSKKVTGLYLGGIISKLRMYEHSLLYHAVFSWKKGWKCSAMRKSTECNCFLVCLFIFCFLNIIIRPFFRDINFTLRKRVILLQQDYAFSNMYHLRSASENRQCNNNYSRRLPVQRTRSMSGVIVLFVYCCDVKADVWRHSILSCVKSVLLLDDDKNWAI